MSKTARDLSVIKEMEKLLTPILSPRQPFSEVEASFAQLEDIEQSRALHWAGVVAASNIELSYVYAVNVGKAGTRLSQKGRDVWLNEALALYDREGLYPAMEALRDVDGFAGSFRQRSYTCYLHEVKPGLDLFVRGLAGRALALKPGSEVYTDTEYLYLPDSISRYPDKSKNRALYKAMASFLWAQTWYGTFKRESYRGKTTQERLDTYEDSTRASRYFLVLENVRLLSKIERDLPGLYRELSAFSPLVIPNDKTWKTISKRLRHEEASVEDTFEALETMMKLKPGIPQTEYQGDLRLGEVETKIEERRAQTIEDISELLNNQVVDEAQLAQSLDAVASTEQQQSIQPDQTNSDLAQAQQEIPGNAQLNQLLKSMLQDVSDLGESFLGDMVSELDAEKHKDKDGEITSVLSENIEIIELDEWDYLRHTYREKWCQVNIRTVEERFDNFKQQVEAKYPYLTRQVRKVFEAMRDLPRYENRQTDGDEIDLDAVVETYTARLAGEELSERMYIRRQQSERSVAVCLLVDMSGSTKGWINEAMRESLILFSEALNTLGDHYSILGFSGLTRQRCEIYRIKEFEDRDPVSVSNRISNIQAKDYTRMGFAVRYATRSLLGSEGKHRILLMLSDGKPDDYDGYQGEYGIQDTRKAILEAQGHGIATFSITIDKQAQIYLPRLFGPGQYMILNDVTTLPVKLSDVYRKLSA